MSFRKSEEGDYADAGVGIGGGGLYTDVPGGLVRTDVPKSGVPTGAMSDERQDFSDVGVGDVGEVRGVGEEPRSYSPGGEGRATPKSRGATGAMGDEGEDFSDVGLGGVGEVRGVGEEPRSYGAGVEGPGGEAACYRGAFKEDAEEDEVGLGGVPNNFSDPTSTVGYGDMNTGGFEIQGGEGVSDEKVGETGNYGETGTKFDDDDEAGGYSSTGGPGDWGHEEGEAILPEENPSLEFVE